MNDFDHDDQPRNGFGDAMSNYCKVAAFESFDSAGSVNTPWKGQITNFQANHQIHGARANLY